MHTDVLIVGAGPTGLMLANQLTRHGVRPMIIDRNAGPAVQTRALGVQARTLEIYSQLDLDEHALDLGTRTVAANIWAQGRHAARVPVGDIGQGKSPFPFILILGQDDNERILGDLLRSRGGGVDWRTELIALEQAPDHVKATLQYPDGTTGVITAGWVAGCDGARSRVRELSGIPFEGAPYEDVFFVADTVATGSMTPNELNVYLWRRGFHLFFPMKGKDHWRLVGILPSELRGRDDVRFEDVIPSLRQEAGAGLSFPSCSWFSTYRIHHRRAARFRAGRCFVLGDAAHVHSPVGAQGMNTGLQDAYNLGWKLGLVVSGRARDSLLDSYEAERRPVADRLLNTTDRLFSLIVSDNWLAGQIRTRVFPRALRFAMRFRKIRELAFRTISQTGIRYPRSPLSENLGSVSNGAPKAGDRFPWMRLQFEAGGPSEDLFARLDDRRFNLILVGQAPPAGGLPELGEPVRIHRVASGNGNQRELARAGVPTPSYYLLRPDCYVGLAGGVLDPADVTRYAAERLRVNPSAGSN